jgi:hypothetical protein
MSLEPDRLRVQGEGIIKYIYRLEDECNQWRRLYKVVPTTLELTGQVEQLVKLARAVEHKMVVTKVIPFTVLAMILGMAIGYLLHC